MNQYKEPDLLLLDITVEQGFALTIPVKGWEEGEQIEGEV